jgi:hypothetical protein
MSQLRDNSLCIGFYEFVFTDRFMSDKKKHGDSPGNGV